MNVAIRNNCQNLR